MSGVQTLTVAEDEGEQRLDRWLRRRFPQLNQVAIEKLCRTGQLRVDGGRVKPAARVAPGQQVRVPPLPEAPAAPAVARAGPSDADAAMIQAAVLWKDQHVIALNKPPGLPSQGGSGQGDRHVDGLTAALTFGYKERPKLVHRLDKDTSGVLLLARTDRVARALSAAFASRTTRKIYWAAVAGVPSPRMGTIRFGRADALHPPLEGRRDRGRQARHHRFRRARGARHPALVVRARARDRPHPPVARAYGRDRPPDHRRRQIWRLGAGEPG